MALESGELVLVDLGAGSTVRRFRAHAERIGAIAIGGDPLCVFSASDDNTVRVWPVDPTLALEHAAAVGASDPAVRLPTAALVGR